MNIFDKNKNLIAQVYNVDEMDKTQFPTPESATMQFGVGVICEDKELNPHIHKRVERKIDTTGEFLYVVHGLMTVEIYDEQENVIETVELRDNMGLLQFIGGHFIKLQKGTKYFEIKQGPYYGKDFDKYEL